MEFGKACEDLSWNHCTSTPHRSETTGNAERAVRRVKEGTSAVLLQSGLNESWWADCMECYTFLRNVTDLLSDGKTPYERRFGQPFSGPVIPFGSLVEFMTLFLPKTNQESSVPTWTGHPATLRVLRSFRTPVEQDAGLTKTRKMHRCKPQPDLVNPEERTTRVPWPGRRGTGRSLCSTVLPLLRPTPPVGPFHHRQTAQGRSSPCGVLPLPAPRRRHLQPSSSRHRCGAMAGTRSTSLPRPRVFGRPRRYRPRGQSLSRRRLWTRELQPPCKSELRPPPEDIHGAKTPASAHAAR